MQEVAGLVECGAAHIAVSRASRRTGQTAVTFGCYAAPSSSCLDHAVALARALLQSVAIEHRDVAARVTYQVDLLQLARGFGHALAAHAEHAGDQLLGHHALIARQAVQAEQQPAAELLVERVRRLHTAVCAIWVISAWV